MNNKNDKAMFFKLQKKISCKFLMVDTNLFNSTYKT